MMSDEQQQQQQQQQRQQQQHQQQLQQHKLSKEQASNAASPTTPPRKTNIHEMRNQDYVSRLLAAMPPYLYSAPVGPNNFFFSDMLRSLVQARNNENARNLQLQQQSVLARRPRKRSWSQQRPFYENMRERKDTEEKQQLNNAVGGVKAVPEKPLELTNKPFFQLPPKYTKTELVKDNGNKLTAESNAKEPSLEFEQTPNSGGAVDAVLQNTPPAASLPPQDLVLPPPPPVWYPPLYPPYGIDPLHFFIDLRVSGHIYDRKKENVSPLATADNNSSASTESENSAATNVSLLNKHRHGSAFTVPVPRSNDVAKAAAAADAINLSANKFENYAKYYDLGETKENQPSAKSSASYMLQHLPRLYSQFAARDLIAANAVETTGCVMDSKSEPDCDADSIDERASADNCSDSAKYRERDIDVEIIDSIRYRTDGESSRCSSGDEASVTQID